MTSVARQGSVIAGRYRLTEPIGSGGMGEVWSASDEALDRNVAIKLILPGNASGPMLARFHREARVTASIHSEHVVQVLDYGDEHDTAYLVLELLQGETLRDRLGRESRLGWESTRALTRDVLTGLAAAHCRQVVHRDLKPENVFIVESADGPRAKVIDFGVAGLLQADATAITGTDAILGSPAYLSPEQLRAEPTDHRTDLWSMGVIALECATGENPFVAVDILDLWQRVCEDPLPRPSAFGTVPPGFDEWFVKAVSRDRAARFESAEAMRQALARLPAQRSGTVVG